MNETLSAPIGEQPHLKEFFSMKPSLPNLPQYGGS